MTQSAPGLQISGLDHLVLTVNDLNRSCRFYQQVLGMTRIDFGGHRIALGFGSQKINLHLAGAEITPHARCPLPGSADVCLLLATPLEAAIAHLQALNIPLAAGPVERTGATGAIMSIYLRDPDGNLIELAVPAGSGNGPG
jgi:catechol 2,3-dioxygenase-like lactoylglutathione lyase family enzyme